MCGFLRCTLHSTSCIVCRRCAISTKAQRGFAPVPRRSSAFLCLPVPVEPAQLAEYRQWSPYEYTCRRHANTTRPTRHVIDIASCGALSYLISLLHFRNLQFRNPDLAFDIKRFHIRRDWFPSLLFHNRKRSGKQLDEGQGKGLRGRPGEYDGGATEQSGQLQTRLILKRSARPLSLQRMRLASVECR